MLIRDLGFKYTFLQILKFDYGLKIKFSPKANTYLVEKTNDIPTSIKTKEKMITIILI